MTFHYTDPDGDHLYITPTSRHGQPALNFRTARADGQGGAAVDIPVDQLEDVVAGARDTARQATAAVHATCTRVPTTPVDEATVVVAPDPLANVSASPVAGPSADWAALRDRIAETMARADGWDWAAANFSSLSTPAADRYRRCADAVLALLPAPTDQAAVLREAADRYAKLTDQNEAYDREHGQLNETARLQHGTVRDVVAGLRRMADKTQPAEAPAQERHDDPWPVKESTRRYAEELRRTPGQAAADGHTGWECEAGAQWLVAAETPRPGRVATHHGTIYACATHRDAAVERITGAGYGADPRPAPPGHRWNPWPCGHVTAHDAAALAALASEAQQERGGGRRLEVTLP
ncbi:hypothetical protein [Streptomyces sp. NPDC127105]|uniref:hypothetical protein n=1 Tax=Streptomyces sp. NPDC127105 TaxID=3345359 RepID=UPI00365327A5